MFYTMEMILRISLVHIDIPCGFIFRIKSMSHRENSCHELLHIHFECEFIWRHLSHFKMLKIVKHFDCCWFRQMLFVHLFELTMNCGQTKWVWIWHSVALFGRATNSSESSSSSSSDQCTQSIRTRVNTIDVDDDDGDDNRLKIIIIE